MNATPTFQPPRFAPNLRHAWGGVWRLTFRRMLMPAHWLTLLGGLGVLALFAYGEGREARPEHFLAWTGRFYVSFLVPALAFMAAGGVMREEMRSGNVDYVLTRPLPRPAFVVFKFLAHTICTQISFLFSFLLVMLFAAGRNIPDFPAFAWQIGYGQALMITAFGAFGFCCGAITSRYFVIGLGYAGVVEMGVGQIPTQISRLSMTNQMRQTLAPWWEHSAEAAAAASWWTTTALLLGFAAVMLAVAAVIFSWRELSGPADS